MVKRISLLTLLLVLPAHAARPFRHGAISTEHPAASAAAVQMLEKGGNAVDAAVAAAFALSVVGPYHSGIGGGGFALVHEKKTGQTRVLDFREVAPKAAHRDMFVRDGKVDAALATDGGLSVAVPTAAVGYLELLRAAGRLKPQVVLAPAIRLAREGFWVTPGYQKMARARLECLRKDSEASRLFLRPNAEGAPDVPAVGTLLRQPELARTLVALSQQGAKALQTGARARAIEETVKRHGGVLTQEDLANAKVRWRAPLETTYRGHRVLTMPPPSAGGLAVVQVLGALELLGPHGLASREVGVLHRYVETLRRAYLDRGRYLGDPAFVDVPLDRLASRPYIEGLVATIDPKAATPSQRLTTSVPPSDALAPKNTAHISAIDAQGNAVAMTTTVNYWFGACLVAKGTGVLLNDQMDDFAAQPGVPNTYGLIGGEANAIAPGKIPLSSMSPTLVFQRDDPQRVMLAVGSPGGSTIPTTVIQVISNVIDGKMDVARAVAFGRLHHQYLPDVIRVDAFGLEPQTQKALEALGHKVQRSDGWGDAHAVMVDPSTGLVTAAADPRNEGEAMGRD